ncbi:MAG TPA: hypothetical protein VN857_16735 [Chthoniobacterales bacterium]|nr:hypothetical protein [Chthoniobacterales bacterium]
MIAKQPHFDRFRAAIDATFGEYDLNRYIVDFGSPIIPEKLAFRISYSGEESGSYYRIVFTQSQAIYAVLKWAPSPNCELEILNSFFETNYQLNRGINRQPKHSSITGPISLPEGPMLEHPAR